MKYFSQPSENKKFNFWLSDKKEARKYPLEAL